MVEASPQADQREGASSLASRYDEQYYREHLGPLPYERSPAWLSHYGRVADAIIQTFRPSSVLDAGCAFGFLVESLWDRSVPCDGFDISNYAISQVRSDVQSYCSVKSIATPIDRRYDLITCIEVLEHLPESELSAAIANLTAATETILFSSTPDDFAEPTHISVRPTLVWIERFAAQGFGVDWQIDCSFVSPHAMVFRRASEPQNRDMQRLYASLVSCRSQSHNRAVAMQARDAQIDDLHGTISGVQEKARKEAERAASLESDLDSSRQAIASLQEQLRELQAIIDGHTRLEGTISDLGDAVSREVKRRAVLSARLERAASALRLERREMAAMRRSFEAAIADERARAAAAYRELETALYEANEALQQQLHATQDATVAVQQDATALLGSWAWRLRLAIRGKR